MADLYTCSGNQTWEIFDTGVRCTACETTFNAYDQAC